MPYNLKETNIICGFCAFFLSESILFFSINRTFIKRAGKIDQFQFVETSLDKKFTRIDWVIEYTFSPLHVASFIPPTSSLENRTIKKKSLYTKFGNITVVYIQF